MMQGSSSPNNSGIVGAALICRHPLQSKEQQVLVAKNIKSNTDKPIDHT
jgi:hypothetical protein